MKHKNYQQQFTKQVCFWLEIIDLNGFTNSPHPETIGHQNECSTRYGCIFLVIIILYEFLNGESKMMDGYGKTNYVA